MLIFCISQSNTQSNSNNVDDGNNDDDDNDGNNSNNNPFNNWPKALNFAEFNLYSLHRFRMDDRQC